MFFAEFLHFLDILTRLSACVSASLIIFQDKKSSLAQPSNKNEEMEGRDIQVKKQKDKKI